MLLKEFATPSIIEGSEDDHEVHSYHHLDELLVKLCGMVVESLKEGPPAPWMVAAGIKTKEYPFFARTGHMSDSGHVHAEHVVLKEFTAKYGEVPEGSIMLVTLSPCNRHDDKTAHQRVGESCSELIAEHGIEKVYCGLIDPSQAHGSHDHRHYTLIETENASIRALCEQFANTFLHGEERIYEAAAWQKKSGKNKNGGLNQKGVNSYRREHPGSKLKTAVTTKPSKLKKGSKASKRRKSFCARMKGMKKHRTGSKTAHDPNSRINKSLRKWHCESIEEMRDLIMLGESYIAEVKQRLDAKCWKGKHKAGTKIKGGVRVNNCVPNESVKEAANAAQQAAIAIAKKKDKNVDENFADGKVKITLYTDPNYYGAEVDDSAGNGKPVIQVPLSKLVGFEPDDKMKSAKSSANMEKMVKLIKSGKGSDLPPILVRRYEGGYQVLDGHHRYHAYTAAGAKTIPAKLIPADEIKIIDKAPTNENFADGKGPGRPGDSARHGIPKHATKSELEKASHAKGRKGQLARWQINMRSGKKKHHKE